MQDAAPEPPASETDVIRFGERVIGLLDAASYSTTYKFALLVALIDCCMELSDLSGEPASRIHPRRLAEKVVSLYWRHTNPFGADASGSPLRQSNSGQAEIITIIATYRRSALLPLGALTTEARFRDPEGFARLVSSIEWKLVEMPLPRLQRVGQVSMSFLYEIDWDESIRQKDYRSSGFDQEVHLKPDVARQFVRLAGILRPLIQQLWSARVARYNKALAPDGRLDEFLFGVDRLSPLRLRLALTEIQEGRCFYTGERLGQRVHIDHFMPWARYPNDAIENLVVALPSVNSAKSAFLAAPNHLHRWFEHNHEHGHDLASVAAANRWASLPDETANVARAIYLGLPDGVMLWSEGKELVPAERSAVLAAIP